MSDAEDKNVPLNDSELNDNEAGQEVNTFKKSIDL